MAAGRAGSIGEQAKVGGGATRPVNLDGDSPEVVAFALLRYLAQLEQATARQTGVVFDRDWLLDAYAECLDAVKGNRSTAASDDVPAPRGAGKGRTSR